MAKIFKSLNAVSADTTGSALDVGGVSTDITVQVTATGITPETTGAVLVEVSLDGTNWSTVGWYFYILMVSLSDISISRGNIDPLSAGTVASRFRPTPSEGGLAAPHFRYARAVLGGLTDTGVTVSATLAVSDIETGSFLPF